jgi:hypothetical protein
MVSQILNSECHLIYQYYGNQSTLKELIAVENHKCQKSPLGMSFLGKKRPEWKKEAGLNRARGRSKLLNKRDHLSDE